LREKNTNTSKASTLKCSSLTLSLSLTKQIHLAATPKKYFIQQYLQEKYLHGGVGGVDAEKILLAKGFEPLLFPHQTGFSVTAKFSRFIYLFKLFFRIKKGSVIVFLFPLYARMNRLLLRILAAKQVRFICFIADINGLKDGDRNLLEAEIAFFRRYTYFVVHNARMNEWLHEHMPSAIKTAEIGFFDFLTTPVIIERTPSPDIVFAGNLEKSRFLNQLGSIDSLRFHLYGAGHTVSMLEPSNVEWHGIELPEDLPAKLEGSFGLVWDGDSAEMPAGSLGDYMQYISHHKLSLYILSGLPLVVPATAGSASVVLSYGIGITVKNLHEIADRIKTISIAEYREMQNNMQPLAQRISEGKCLGSAIDQLMEE
jgi:hypothetical protein